MKNTHAVVTVAVAVVACTGSGAAVASTPVSRTPHVCVLALARVADLDELQGDLLYQVRMRGDALGKDAYKAHDDEVRRVLTEMEPAEASYVSARAQCLDAS